MKQKRKPPIRKGKRYTFLISYNFNSDKGSGVGSTTQFFSERKFLTKQELHEAREILSEENGYSNIVINGYQVLGVNSV